MLPINEPNPGSLLLNRDCGWAEVEAEQGVSVYGVKVLTVPVSHGGAGEQ